MKILIYILIVLATIVIYDIGYFLWHVRIGRRLAAVAQPYERITPEAKYKILIIGDSTALGTGSSDPRQSVAGLFGQNYPNTTIFNRGKNGRKTEEIPVALQEFPDNSFDLMIIHAGANDILYLTPLDKLEKDLGDALAVAQQKAAKVAILHSGNVGAAPLFSWPVNRFYESRTRAVREIYIKKTGDTDVVYVDIFTERADDPFLKDIKNSYAIDMLHLGPKGNQIWFDKINSTLKKAGIIIPTE